LDSKEYGLGMYQFDLNHEHGIWPSYQRQKEKDKHLIACHS